MKCFIAKCKANVSCDVSRDAGIFIQLCYLITTSSTMVLVVANLEYNMLGV